jgi:transcriptional regulator with XRE-family HTH domain
MINIKLKTAILESGKYQDQIAREAGMGEVRLSRISRGKAKPTEAEKIILSRILKKGIEELF